MIVKVSVLYNGPANPPPQSAASNPSAPVSNRIDYELSRDDPLNTHIAALCQRFSAGDPSNYVLQLEASKIYLNDAVLLSFINNNNIIIFDSIISNSSYSSTLWASRIVCTDNLEFNSSKLCIIILRSAVVFIETKQYCFIIILLIVVLKDYSRGEIPIPQGSVLILRLKPNLAAANSIQALQDSNAMVKKKAIFDIGTLMKVP